MHNLLQERKNYNKEKLINSNYNFNKNNKIIMIRIVGKYLCILKIFNLLYKIKILKH